MVQRDGKGQKLAGGGEASCISQICHVIKLIKRLTHAGLALFSVSVCNENFSPLYIFLFA